MGLPPTRGSFTGLLSPFSTQDLRKMSFGFMPKILQKGKVLRSLPWPGFVLPGVVGPLVDFPSNDMPTPAVW